MQIASNIDGAKVGNCGEVTFFISILVAKGLLTFTEVGHYIVRKSRGSGQMTGTVPYLMTNIFYR